MVHPTPPSSQALKPGGLEGGLGEEALFNFSKIIN